MVTTKFLSIIEEISKPSRDPNAAMTFKQWCIRNQFSEPTGRRILAGGDGPDVTRFSPNRMGVTFAADDAWKARRKVRRSAPNNAGNIAT